MPEFRYRAKDKAGRIVAGAITAENPDDLRRKLLGRELRVVDLSPVQSKPLEEIGILARFKRITQKDLALFTWQLYTMTNAGIPLIRSLNSIIRQTKNERFKGVIREIVIEINNGMSLSETMKKHAKVFSPFFVSMVEVGEVGGALDEILESIAKYYETSVERRSRIISALSYPMLLFTGCIGVVFFLVLFLVPRLFVMFENIGADVPMTTMILIDISSFIKHKILYILGGIAALVLAIKYYTTTSSGRYAVAGMVLRIPIAGTILKKIIFSRFSHSLSIMINGGVPLLSSLRITRDIVRNAAVCWVVDDLIEGVSEGDSINEVLSRHRLIPDMVVNMVAVGEETGTLAEMLTKVSSYYDREVNNAINSLAKIIEPVLLVGMAVVVGFIAISILDPVTDLITNLNR